jgi:hypothetical protein
VQKYLQGVVNGVQSEGPQSREGRGEPPTEANVVQFGDWIGPRDELVPFGRRHRSRAAERTEAPLWAEPLPAPSDSPPSADDFWGERAAAIHDPMQGPLSDCPPTDAAPGPDMVGPRSRSIRRRWTRRLVAAGACGLVVVLASVALGLGLFAAGANRGPNLNAAKLPLASVLSSGVAHALSLDVPRIAPRPQHASSLPAAHRAGATRRPPRTHPISEAVRYTPSPRTSSTTSFHTAATASSARLSLASPTAATDGAESAPANTSRPGSTSTASSSTAAVSATGQSGALGPIQSPNG